MGRRTDALLDARLAATEAKLRSEVAGLQTSEADEQGAPLLGGRRLGALASLGRAMLRRGMDPLGVGIALLAENRRRCVPPLGLAGDLGRGKARVDEWPPPEVPCGEELSADELEEWPPREQMEAESAAAQLVTPPKRAAPQRQGSDSIAQMMERWAAKLSPAEQRQWREHGTFMGWEMPRGEAS